jgi:hypothetical protein
LTEEEREASKNQSEEDDGIELAELNEDDEADLMREIEEQR